MKKLGIYIHIPFCKRKCHYCDFISFSGKQELIEKYINSLKQEINKCKVHKEEYQVETIYVGGRNSIIYREQIYYRYIKSNKK